MQGTVPPTRTASEVTRRFVASEDHGASGLFGTRDRSICCAKIPNHRDPAHKVGKWVIEKGLASGEKIFREGTTVVSDRRKCRRLHIPCIPLPDRLDSASRADFERF